jgi:hypothetical protein
MSTDAGTTTETPTAKTRGQIAYEAYCAATDWKSLVNGKALPQWVEVKDNIKAAWEKSAEGLVVMLADKANEMEAKRIADSHVEQVNQIAALLRERRPGEFVEFPTSETVVFVVTQLVAEAAGVTRRFDDAGVVKENSGLTLSLEGRAVAVTTRLKEVEEERDEILARVLNALDLKGGELKDALEAIAELKDKTKGADVTKVKAFEAGRLTCRRTGRLIEIRLAETGQPEKELLERVVATLNASGIGNH